MAFSRFMIAGAVNTGLTYAIYLGLLIIVPYVFAYSLAYAIGIGMGYLLNAKWVFQRPPSLGSATVYPLTYSLNYLMGVGMLWLLIELIHIPKEIAPLFVVAVSIPLMYIVTKSIFLGKPTNEKNNN
jgi:putative flippase GtrA